MLNPIEIWRRRGDLQTPDSFVAVDLLNADLIYKKLFNAQIKRNSGLVTVLVHPFFRENTENGKCPFPLTPKYTEARDSFITSAVEQGNPLIIFEEAARCSALAAQIAAKRGIVYWIATCNGDATPAFIKNNPQYGPFMHHRTRMRLEAETWDRVSATLKEAGARHLTVGGRYMVLHEPTTDYGQRFLADLKEISKRKKFAKEMLYKNLIPGACPGQVMIRLLQRGLDISLSDISSPTNKLTVTDLTNHPDLRMFY